MNEIVWFYSSDYSQWDKHKIFLSIWAGANSEPDSSLNLFLYLWKREKWHCKEWLGNVLKQNIKCTVSLSTRLLSQKLYYIWIVYSIGEGKETYKFHIKLSLMGCQQHETQIYMSAIVARMQSVVLQYFHPCFQYFAVGKITS